MTGLIEKLIAKKHLKAPRSTLSYDSAIGSSIEEGSHLSVFSPASTFQPQETCFLSTPEPSCAAVDSETSMLGIDTPLPSNYRDAERGAKLPCVVSPILSESKTSTSRTAIPHNIPTYSGLSQDDTSPPQLTVSAEDSSFALGSSKRRPGPSSPDIQPPFKRPTSSVPRPIERTATDEMDLVVFLQGQADGRRCQGQIQPCQTSHTAISGEQVYAQTADTTHKPEPTSTAAPMKERTETLHLPKSCSRLKSRRSTRNDYKYAVERWLTAGDTVPWATQLAGGSTTEATSGLCRAVQDLHRRVDMLLRFRLESTSSYAEPSDLGSGCSNAFGIETSFGTDDELELYMSDASDDETDFDQRPVAVEQPLSADAVSRSPHVTQLPKEPLATQVPGVRQCTQDTTGGSKRPTTMVPNCKTSTSDNTKKMGTKRLLSDGSSQDPPDDEENDGKKRKLDLTDANAVHSASQVPCLLYFGEPGVCPIENTKYDHISQLM